VGRGVLIRGESLNRNQKSEGRRRKPEARKQMAESRWNKAEGRKQMIRGFHLTQLEPKAAWAARR
jgi:hypothetical protein